MALDILSDGFVSVCIDPSLNFYDGKCRVLVEGQYVVNGALAVPIVADVPIKIESVRFVDDMFTAGSILAEGLKKLFCTCPNYVEVYALPRADAGAGVAAVYDITITGPATSDGTFDLFLGDEEYSISVIVTSGDTVATMAANLLAEIPAGFPYTVTTTATGLHMVAKNKGTVGNFLNPVYNWKAYQNYAPAGVTVSTVRTTAGSVDPAAIDYAAALGQCCYNCYALLGGSTTWQRGLRDHIRDAWDCTKPQCFGHGYTYNSGSLGTVLATGNNSAELSRIAVPTNDLNFPWALVATYAAKSCCTACDNPELSTQGRTHGVLHCVKRPTNCAEPWTLDEQTQLREAGFVVYGPLTRGQGQITSPYIYNDVTNSLYDDLGRPNVTFRDANSRRLAASTAIKAATMLQQYSGLALFTRNTSVPQGVFGTTQRAMLADLHHWARSEVGRLFSDFDDLQKDLTLKEDFEVAPPCRGVPCVLHMNLRYRPPCRISRVNVNAQPMYLDNCVR